MVRTGLLSPDTCPLRFCNEATAVLPLLNGSGIASRKTIACK